MDVINITEKMLMNGLEDGEYYQDGQIITNNYDAKSMCLVRTTDVFQVMVVSEVWQIQIHY